MTFVVLRRRPPAMAWSVQGSFEAPLVVQARAQALEVARAVIAEDPQTLCWVCRVVSSVTLTDPQLLTELEL